MKYSIDTSALINLSRYPKDIFKGLWIDFDKLCASHVVVSSDAVVDELAVREGDELLEWCKQRDNFLYPLDIPMQEALTEVNSRCNLVDHENHRSEGDPFVVAIAYLNDLSVISDEKPRKHPAARMKIPDACQEMGLRHLSLFDFIRSEGWTY
ncbi:MAG: DUF4411 family protein [Deltaproteobacteria bacterium]|nr:DUF4411 family protein [Deltaproteobacteria bacterium]